MMRRVILISMLWFMAGISARPAWSADPPKPIAYVVTGWNKDSDNKSTHDKIAAEAKKDLENAGYEVTVVTEATAEQFKYIVKESNAKALVFIDHGHKTKQKLAFKRPGPGNELEAVNGSDFSGTYPNFDIVTIHACGQYKKSWMDKFPNAAFESWPGLDPIQA